MSPAETWHRSRLSGLAAVALLGFGCGGNRARLEAESERFSCKQRAVSYVASKHIGCDELGVLMDCHERGPRIIRWCTDKLGNRKEDSRSITPGEFDATWREIDATGWQNLRDCANGSLEPSDPVYVFDVKDDQHKSSFQCQTRVMPFPYNDITDPLDLAANQGRKQLRDDEPRDAKALDKKDKQR